MTQAVTAKLKYLSASSGTPSYRASVGGAGAGLDMEGQFEEHGVTIRNGRIHSGGGFSLDREGFVLIPHTTRVSDFYDDKQITRVYEQEVRKLISEASGAGRVVVFDHTLRSDDPKIREKRQTREPASVVHNDYSDRSARKRLAEILGEGQSARQRFAIINVWRPVNNPVFTSPLTVCAADSIASEDLVPTERQARDRTGELMLVKFDDRHRWCYFPAMQVDEALLIKTFDSATDGRARLSIHTSFEDPTAPVDAPPRESIETRAFAIFG